MSLRACFIFTLTLVLIFWFAPDLWANPPLIMRGVAKTLFSVFEIPRSIMQQSSTGMFPLSLITGTLTGSVRMVMGTLGGALDIVQGAAPYAKYALLFV